jgi:hypothetical protein
MRRIIAHRGMLGYLPWVALRRATRRGRPGVARKRRTIAGTVMAQTGSAGAKICTKLVQKRRKKSLLPFFGSR